MEDEARLLGQLGRAIGNAGYAVNRAADGVRADFLIASHRTPTADYS